jgi:diguanylate cyclase (GGDEF)-like protein
MARFEALGTFPSPPGIAQEIIALAKSPDTTITSLTGCVSKDPALATKVLRMANSAFYAQRRRSQNLRQALLVIGLDAAITLCLSFSITASFRKARAGGLDYGRYWRRSLLAALTSRCIGEELGTEHAEELFLAGLLQDIGVVALDRAKPGFYAELAKDATHAQFVAYERERLNEDHAALGAWLLGHWNLPELLCRTLERSHTPDSCERTTDDGRFVRTVALAGEIAAAMLARDRRKALAALKERANELLALTQSQLKQVVERVAELAPDMSQLFETTLLSPDDAMLLMEQAKDLLAERSVESLMEIGALQQATTELAARSDELADASRRDSLTQVYNRRYLDERLPLEFDAANQGGWALGVLFVDLDHFKSVNDRFGHPAGDAVLRAAAQGLLSALRESDLVARYGGEEFVVLLPGVSVPDARCTAERLLVSLRELSHEIGGETLQVTASIGLAVHAPGATYATPDALLGAADAGAYAAKRAGRDRLCDGPAAAGSA